MDRDQVRLREAACIAEEAPACTAGCPVHVDARGMLEKLARGDLEAALEVYLRSAPLPRTLARVCEAPCQAACRRGEAGGAVAIGELERALVRLARWPVARRRPPLAARSRTVAVVGAGATGLTAALELAAKGYPVTLFEAGARPGGRLLKFAPQVLPPEALAADLEGLQRVTLKLGELAPPTEALAAGFDAVVLATGPSAAGRAEVDPVSLATAVEKVFAAGAARLGAEAGPLARMHDGRRAATSVDRFLQRASLVSGREQEGPYPTRLFTRVSAFAPAPPLRPAGPGGFTREEAVAEAARCFPCHCRECLDACPYLRHHGATPRRYTREIYNNDTIVMGNHSANRLANSCALCGLCEVVCPQKGVRLAETCREARQSMVDRGKMPPSTHAFALDELAFNQGPDFALCENAPGTTSSRAVFFPGCSLSASAPGQVEQVYALLRAELKDVGLMLGCCGAPADWAGRRDLLTFALKEVASGLERLGATRLITACPTCTGVFRQHLPHLEVSSLWTVLAALPPGALPGAAAPGTRLAVHDACASRFDPSTQDAVRSLLGRAGVEVVEPAYTRERTTCCGQGGLMAFAAREVAAQVADQRVAERPEDYVSACAMCRDRFAARGKRSLHLLDVVLGAPADAATRRAAGHSQRREGRRRLKARLEATLWQRPVAAEAPPMELRISEAVQAQLEARMILTENLARAIAHAEATGDALLDAATGHRLASHRPAQVTYWVEYSPEGTGFEVHRAWSHRMELEEGPR